MIGNRRNVGPPMIALWVPADDGSVAVAVGNTAITGCICSAGGAEGTTTASAIIGTPASSMSW